MLVCCYIKNDERYKCVCVVFCGTSVGGSGNAVTVEDTMVVSGPQFEFVLFLIFEL